MIKEKIFRGGNRAPILFLHIMAGISEEMEFPGVAQSAAKETV